MTADLLSTYLENHYLFQILKFSILRFFEEKNSEYSFFWQFNKSFIHKTNKK